MLKAGRTAAIQTLICDEPISTASSTEVGGEPGITLKLFVHCYILSFTVLFAYCHVIFIKTETIEQ